MSSRPAFPEPDQRGNGSAAAELQLPTAERAGLHAHRCPVCDKRHLVNQVRHSLAYGRQLTCCCECEVQKRKLQQLSNRMHAGY